MEQLTSWAEALVEQGAVALGLLTEEEVAKDSEVSSAELRRRFSAEACELKAPSEASGSFFVCGSAPEIDTHGSGHPSAAQCENALRLWLGRLTAQSPSAPNALEAMLQSQALNVSLMAMSRSKAGRETIHQAVRSGQGKSEPMALWEILKLSSAAPTELLVRLVRFLDQSAEQLAQSREQGVKYLQGKEQMLQWTVTLICSSLSDAQELALYRDGHPAEVFRSVEIQLAEDLNGSPRNSAPGSSEQLDALERLGTTFQALRTVCEDLVASRKKKENNKKSKESAKPVATQVPENTLSAMISCLGVLRLENAVVGSRTDQDSELTDAVRAASLEVEALLKARLQRVTRISTGMAELPNRLEDAGAACLQLEQMRRSRFDEFLEGVKQKVWDSDAHSRLGGDATQIAAEREIIKRGIGLVDQAWREMVGLAAESLDDNNVMGANSEEMSTAAKHYKDMREELKSSMVRLSKLEAEGPPKQKVKVSPPSAEQPAAKPLGASAAKQLAVAQKSAMEGSAASATPTSSKAGAVKAGPPGDVSSEPGSATVPTKASQPVKEAAPAKATASAVPAKSSPLQSTSAPDRGGMADESCTKVVNAPSAKSASKEVSLDMFAGIGHVTVVVTQHSLSNSPWESAVCCDVMELRDHLRQMLGRDSWPAVVVQAAASGSGCGIAITGTTDGGPVKVLCSGPDAAAVKGQLGACPEVASTKTASTAAVTAEAVADVESAMILLTRASAANIWEMAVSQEVLELREHIKHVTGGGDVPAVVLQSAAQPGKSEDSCVVVACRASSKAAQIMCSGSSVAAVQKQLTGLTK